MGECIVVRGKDENAVTPKVPTGIKLSMSYPSVGTSAVNYGPSNNQFMMFKNNSGVYDLITQPSTYSVNSQTKVQFPLVTFTLV